MKKKTQLVTLKMSLEDSQHQSHHWQNVHSIKLYYLDQNLSNFCLLYYTTDPGDEFKQERSEVHCHFLHF